MAVFDIIKMETRVSNMLAWFAARQKKITDLLPGSVTRTKFEAIALEMEQQDYQTYRAITKAIPISIYRAFNFAPLAAVRAAGSVTFSATVAPAQDIPIPKGTLVTTVATSTTPAKTYETTSAATLLAEQTSIAVNIVSTSPGSTGNTGAGTISVLKVTIIGIDTVSNTVALTNGAEAESETDRVRRFQGYISTLAKGTDGALEYGAKTARLTDENGVITEQVTQALAVDRPADTAGFADVYIYNGTGTTSSELIERAQEIVNGYIDADGVKIVGYKAAGVVATVYAATELEQDVTASVSADPGVIAADIENKAVAAIAAYFGGIGIGAALVYNEIVERIMAIDGVYDVVISAPSANANVLAQEVGSCTFAGSGLDDMTAGGPYTGPGRRTYVVKVDGTGGTNTFKWSRDNGATWVATGVDMVAATPVVLEHGLSVTFAAATGHTLNDQWSFVANAAVKILPGDLNISVSY